MHSLSQKKNTTLGYKVCKKNQILRHYRFSGVLAPSHNEYYSHLSGSQFFCNFDQIYNKILIITV
jgi:hypothetical protein